MRLWQRLRYVEGIALYARATRPADRIGSIGLWTCGHRALVPSPAEPAGAGLVLVRLVAPRGLGLLGRPSPRGEGHRVRPCVRPRRLKHSLPMAAADLCLEAELTLLVPEGDVAVIEKPFTAQQREWFVVHGGGEHYPGWPSLKGGGNDQPDIYRISIVPATNAFVADPRRVPPVDTQSIGILSSEVSQISARVKKAQCSYDPPTNRFMESNFKNRKPYLCSIRESRLWRGRIAGVWTPEIYLRHGAM